MDHERRAGRRRAHGRHDRGVVRASSEDVRGAGERAVRGAAGGRRGRGAGERCGTVAAGESAVRACEQAAPRRATWVRSYNLERAHEGLGVCQRVGASASIASGALDLFEVKSGGGKPKQWLAREWIWPAGVAT
jgi:hypothetical protein